MYCRKCGTENPESARYCLNCGEPLAANSAPRTYHDPLSDEYKPISMWGYFGYQLLFGIPFVGLILLLVFSFGGTRNINLKNFARSYFCVLIIVLIVLAILFASGAIAGISQM